jgi:hypothetical protein
MEFFAMLADEYYASIPASGIEPYHLERSLTEYAGLVSVWERLKIKKAPKIRNFPMWCPGQDYLR